MTSRTDEGRPLAAVLSRRQALCCLGGALAALASAPSGAAPWGTACLAPQLPAHLRELVARCLEGLDPAEMWDVHAHLLGTGDGGTGARVHDSLRSGFNPVERFRMRAILDAACVPADAAGVDAAYVDRLLALADAFPAGARWLLFAFEQAHDDTGQPDPAHTTVQVPDAYAAAVAARHPQRFTWVASIHPYRADALDALQRARAAGARAVKWLPSSMNIDLRDPRSLKFADAATAAALPLIVHCGEEKAVPGAHRDDLVNPLHVRAPLERGATVIVAHCASLGHAVDLDRRSAPLAPAFDLFARLMAHGPYRGRLFGDLSAVFQINRRAEVWRAVIERSAAEWRGRLLQGSDYPLPGLRWLTPLSRLRNEGLLTDAEVAPLDALRDHNPLMFDLCLKRSLRSEGTRIADASFATRALFDPATPSTTPGSGKRPAIP